jgi:hypothetical protein
VLDAQNLGNWTNGLTREKWGDSKWTMAAIAYMQAPDGTDLLIVAASTMRTASPRPAG